mmetsp:Transcript_38945/g.122004  ORF Transcript_38945/g.122004 Transcript_38945/m.122004 type:complete len:772 (-) Transcript_38945:1780-4095(-)
MSMPLRRLPRSSSTDNVRSATGSPGPSSAAPASLETRNAQGRRHFNVSGHARKNVASVAMQHADFISSPVGSPKTLQKPRMKSANAALRRSNKEKREFAGAPKETYARNGMVSAMATPETLEARKLPWNADVFERPPSRQRDAFPVNLTDFKGLEASGTLALKQKKKKVPPKAAFAVEPEPTPASNSSPGAATHWSNESRHRGPSPLQHEVDLHWQNNRAKTARRGDDDLSVASHRRRRFEQRFTDVRNNNPETDGFTMLEDGPCPFRIEVTDGDETWTLETAAPASPSRFVDALGGSDAPETDGVPPEQGGVGDVYGEQTPRDVSERAPRDCPMAFEGNGGQVNNSSPALPWSKPAAVAVGLNGVNASAPYASASLDLELDFEEDMLPEATSICNENGEDDDDDATLTSIDARLLQTSLGPDFLSLFAPHPNQNASPTYVSGNMSALGTGRGTPLSALVDEDIDDYSMLYDDRSEPSPVLMTSPERFRPDYAEDPTASNMADLEALGQKLTDMNLNFSSLAKPSVMPFGHMMANGGASAPTTSRRDDGSESNRDIGSVDWRKNGQLVRANTASLELSREVPSARRKESRNAPVERGVNRDSAVDAGDLDITSFSNDATPRSGHNHLIPGRDAPASPMTCLRKGGVDRGADVQARMVNDDNFDDVDEVHDEVAEEQAAMEALSFTGMTSGLRRPPAPSRMTRKNQHQYNNQRQLSPNSPEDFDMPTFGNNTSSNAFQPYKYNTARLGIVTEYGRISRTARGKDRYERRRKG